MLVLGLSVFLCGVFVLALLLVRRTGNRTLEMVEQELGGEGVIVTDRAANFFGLESGPLGQTRGNGCLVLTGRSIAFFMFVPKRRIDISLERVTRLEAPMWWKGKSVGRKLLAIYFNDMDGREDAAAFYVRDRDRWVAEISAVTPGLAPEAGGVGGKLR